LLSKDRFSQVEIFAELQSSRMFNGSRNVERSAAFLRVWATINIGAAAGLVLRSLAASRLALWQPRLDYYGAYGACERQVVG
jgi:hypothetical protein